MPLIIILFCRDFRTYNSYIRLYVSGQRHLKQLVSQELVHFDSSYVYERLNVSTFHMLNSIVRGLKLQKKLAKLVGGRGSERKYGRWYVLFIELA